MCLSLPRWHSPFAVEMGCKKLTGEKSLMLLNYKYSVTNVAHDTGILRQAIYDLKKATASLPVGTVPTRKEQKDFPKAY